MEKQKASKKFPATRSPVEPYDKANPKGPGEHKHLSPSEKAAAKKRARAAGRPYPNLIDNMNVSKAGKK